MIKSIERETIVEMLLNSLEAERYVRGPLLLTLHDELSSSAALAEAADAVSRILAALESGKLGESDFARHVADLRALVRSASPPASGVVAKASPRAPVETSSAA